MRAATESRFNWSNEKYCPHAIEGYLIDHQANKDFTVSSSRNCMLTLPFRILFNSKINKCACFLVKMSAMILHRIDCAV